MGLKSRFECDDILNISDGGVDGVPGVRGTGTVVGQVRWWWRGLKGSRSIEGEVGRVGGRGGGGCCDGGGSLVPPDQRCWGP